MKLIKILTLLIILYTPMLSQWINVGNCDTLNTFNFKTQESYSVNKFAISSDCKYIYTINDENIIKKFDYITGDSIWTKKILPDSLMSFSKYFTYLCSDAKTYAKINYIYKNDSTNFLVQICDIEYDMIIDTCQFDYGNSDYIKMIDSIKECDYSSLNKILFFIVKTKNTEIINGNPIDYNNFILNIKQKNGNSWSSKEYIFEKCSIFYFIKNDFLNKFCIGANDTDEGFFKNNYFYYYDYLQDSLFSLSNTPFFINGIFVSDKKKIILFDRYLLVYQYKIEENSLTYINSEFRFCGATKLAKSFEPDYLFGLSEKKIKIFGNENLYMYNFFEIDSIKEISSLINSPDNQFVFVGNNKGSIYRIISKKLSNMKADFFIPDSTYIVGDTIKFQDYSIGHPDLFYWDFGDGHTSNLQNPSHFYLDTGYYSVRLIVSKNNICDTIIKNNFIHIVTIPLKAEFKSKNTIAQTGDSVRFIDYSSGHPHSYLWDFGDGQFSNERNPIHIYSNVGYYEIKLIISRNQNTDTIIKTGFIHVITRLVADFDYTIIDGYPVTIKFTNKIKGNPSFIEWKFGDGVTESKMYIYDTEHQYIYSGDYKITLSINDGLFYDSFEKNINIHLSLPKLDSSKFSYEFIDTNYNKAIALKGWEDNDDYLVYHILVDDTVYHYGAYQNENVIWDSISFSKNQIERRQNGTYGFMDKYFYNLDKFGNISDKRNYGWYHVPNQNYINKIKSFGNNIVTLFDNEIIVYNEYNDIIFRKFVNNECQSDSLFVLTDYDNKLNIVYYDSSKFDYSTLVAYGGALHVDKWGNRDYASKSCCYTNNFLNSNCNFKDFIRLNDSTLIYIGPSITVNQIVRYVRNYGIRIDSVIVPNICNVSDKLFDNFQFEHILKINNSCFLMAGSYKDSPAYVIVNEKLRIIDSATVPGRIGKINYISITPDSNLLLSGYIYSSYKNKSPYFVKTNNSLIAKLLKENNSTHGNIYYDTLRASDNLNKNEIQYAVITSPNPTNLNTTIKVLLYQKSFIKLKIYDSYGNLVSSDGNKEYDFGEQEFEVNFASYASGIYFYRLEIDNYSYFGQIIFFR